jgi:hypothetical protein
MRALPNLFPFASLAKSFKSDVADRWTYGAPNRRRRKWIENVLMIETLEQRLLLSGSAPSLLPPSTFYSTPHDLPLSQSAPGLLEGASDFEGDALAPVLIDDVDHGTLNLGGDGSFTYTPTLGYVGLDNFTYAVWDGELQSDSATVEITVTPRDGYAAIGPADSTSETAVVEAYAAFSIAIDVARAEYDDAISLADSNYWDEIDAAEAAYALAVAAADAILNGAVATATTTYEAAVAEADLAYESALVAPRADYDGAVNAAQQAYDTAAAQAIADFSAAMSSADAGYFATLADAEAALDAAAASYEQTLADLAQQETDLWNACAADPQCTSPDPEAMQSIETARAAAAQGFESANQDFELASAAADATWQSAYTAAHIAQASVFAVADAERVQAVEDASELLVVAEADAAAERSNFLAEPGNALVLAEETADAAWTLAVAEADFVLQTAMAHAEANRLMAVEAAAMNLAQAETAAAEAWTSSLVATSLTQVGEIFAARAPADTGLAELRTIENPSPDDAPAYLSFPFGHFDLAAYSLELGAATTLTLFLPPWETVNTYYKFGPTPENPSAHWYEFLFDGTTGAEILSDRVVLQFVDGQRGDDDLSANGVIVDPSTPAILRTLSITGVAQPEGNLGTTTFRFDVILSDTTNVPVTVYYNTRDGSATAGSDYVDAGTTASITFNPGERTKPINVSVYGDSICEPAEDFTVTLRDPINAVLNLSQSSALGTISNDDPCRPAITITNVTRFEGNGGTLNPTAFVFDVYLQYAVAQPVTVSYATQQATATQGSDYIGTSGSLTFNPGQTHKTIPVYVVGDGECEGETIPYEQFYVNLNNPSANAVLGIPSSGVGTIQNDDTCQISLSVSDVTLAEGNSGNTNANFLVSLSRASTQTVTVNYSTANGSAIAPDDYTSSYETLTFSPGQTSKTVGVAVMGDTVCEATETFYLNLISPSNASITDSQGAGTITNDDLCISINDRQVTETNGTQNVSFTVTLSAASAQPVTVDYFTGNGSAYAPFDYAAIGGTLTLPPNTLTRLVNVTVQGDTLCEPVENFYVYLANASANATINHGVGVGTILDNDNATCDRISITALDPNAYEYEPLNESMTGTFRLTRTRSAQSQGQELIVNLTIGGSATNGMDYDQIPTTVLIPTSVDTLDIIVRPREDTLVEGNETVQVSIAGGPGYQVGSPSTATVTINDKRCGDNLTSATVYPGSTMWVGTTATYSAWAGSVPVTWINGTYAWDYRPRIGNNYGTWEAVTWGVTSLNTLTVVENTPKRGQYRATLNSCGHITSATTGLVTVQERPPEFSVDDVTVIEPASGSTFAIFTVSLSRPSTQQTRVKYRTENRTAVEPGDYRRINEIRLTFPAGTTTQTASVEVKSDNVQPSRLKRMPSCSSIRTTPRSATRKASVRSSMKTQPFRSTT